jgi:hypothetical protein
MWVLVMIVATSSISSSTSSSISTIGGFSSEQTCLEAAVEFAGGKIVESIGHGVDLFKEVHCLSLADRAKK